MSENITHIGILDDCFRLMLASDEICEAFKEVGRSQKEYARLGGITRSGDRFTVSLLDSFRGRWGSRRPEDRLEPKLAFVLGWLCHRAADRQMKPVFREAEPDALQSPTECSVYHDAFVFHEVFASGREHPYHPGLFEARLETLPAAAVIDVPAVEELFRALLQRSLLELHTFIPDGSDIEGWLDRLFKLQQRFYVDRARYASAIARPEPEKVQRFITGVNFYDRHEPLIGLARAVQRGDTVTGEQVRAAASVDAQSHYGQALKTGFGYLRAASDFFTNDMEPETLSERLDIGKTGRDGKSV